MISFLMFVNVSHLKDFAHYLSTKHRNTNFTYEFEENKCFSFLVLHILIQNSDTSFFKHKFSGVFTNFKSFLPIQFTVSFTHEKFA